MSGDFESESISSNAERDPLRGNRDWRERRRRGIRGDRELRVLIRRHWHQHSLYESEGGRQLS